MHGECMVGVWSIEVEVEVEIEIAPRARISSSRPSMEWASSTIFSSTLSTMAEALMYSVLLNSSLVAATWWGVG